MMAACLALAAASALGVPLQDGENPRAESTCNNEDIGKKNCRAECTCDPVAGARLHMQSPQVDHNTIDIVYYVPGQPFDMSKLQKARVARAFYSIPLGFWTEGEVSDAMHALRTALSGQLHYVFNAVESKREARSIPDGWGTQDGHWVTYTILYGYETAVQGPGTWLQYKTVFSNLPKQSCLDQPSLEHPSDRKCKQGGALGFCSGHYIAIYSHASRYSMVEVRRKDRAPAACDKCETPYHAHMKTGYYAQWSTDLRNMEPVGGAGGPKNPTVDVEVDWGAIAGLVTEAAAKVLPGVGPVISLVDDLMKFVSVKYESGKAEGAAPFDSSLRFVADCETRMDLDEFNVEDPYTLNPVGTPGKNTNSTKDAMDPNTMPATGKHWSPPDKETKDKNGVPMAGEYVTWQTWRDGDFSSFAQIADVIGVVVDMETDGNTYGTAEFYISSQPCLGAVHDCNCKGDRPTGGVVPKREPPIEPTAPAEFDQIGTWARDYLGAVDAVIAVDGDEPVTIELVDDRAFGWSEGVVVVRDQARDAVATDPSDKPEEAPRLQVDPGRADQIMIGSKPDLGRLFNVKFEPRRAKKRLRLRDPADAAGEKTVRLQPVAGTAGETTTLALEVPDASLAPYTLHHGTEGELAAFAPVMVVRQGDRTTYIGRFAGMSARQRSVLESSTAEDLSLVDAKGHGTPLADAAGPIQTGRAAPTLDVPDVVSPEDPVTITVNSDFQFASQVAGVPSSIISTEVYRDGRELLLRTKSPSDQVTTTVRSGEKRINVTARYVLDGTALAEASRTSRATAEELRTSAPAGASDWVMSAINARERSLDPDKPK